MLNDKNELFSSQDFSCQSAVSKERFLQAPLQSSLSKKQIEQEQFVKDYTTFPIKTDEAKGISDGKYGSFH